MGSLEYLTLIYISPPHVASRMNILPDRNTILIHIVEYDIDIVEVLIIHPPPIPRHQVTSVTKYAEPYASSSVYYSAPISYHFPATDSQPDVTKYAGPPILVCSTHCVQSAPITYQLLRISSHQLYVH